MEKKRVIVLFSGGLDSTYLIWKNLEEGNVVLPIYIEIKNNEYKSEIEKNRIYLIYDLLYEKYGNIIEKPLELLDICLKSSCGGGELLFKQLPIWLLGVLYLQDKSVDEIQLGYVMNDDMVSYVDDVKTIYDSYKSILRKIIPLKFPLLKTKKNEIISELPKEYFDLTISCENPLNVDKNNKIFTYTPCGCCDACVKIIYNDYYKTYDYYKEIILRKSVDELISMGYEIYNEKGIRLDNTIYEPVACNHKEEPIQLTIPFK